ncbi:MAG: hypothetical protein NVS9B1_26400 [Candidatus Dormibacteraceae bacterium]
MAAEGYVVGADGNLSTRLGDEILITPSGVGYDHLEAGAIVAIDLSGAGGANRSSEWMVHTEIYRARPNVNAVIHAHPIYACVLAVRGEALEPILDEVGPVLGGAVAVAEYGLSGTPLLAANAVAGLGARHAVILRNHGTVTVGADLEEAFYRLALLERAAHIQVLR